MECYTYAPGTQINLHKDLTSHNIVRICQYVTKQLGKGYDIIFDDVEHFGFKFLKYPGLIYGSEKIIKIYGFTQFNFINSDPHSKMNSWLESKEKIIISKQFIKIPTWLNALYGAPCFNKLELDIFTKAFELEGFSINSNYKQLISTGPLGKRKLLDFNETSKLHNNNSEPEDITSLDKDLYIKTRNDTIYDQKYNHESKFWNNPFEKPEKYSRTIPIIKWNPSLNNTEQSFLNSKNSPHTKRKFPEENDENYFKSIPIIKCDSSLNNTEQSLLNLKNIPLTKWKITEENDQESEMITIADDIPPENLSEYFNNEYFSDEASDFENL